MTLIAAVGRPALCPAGGCEHYAACCSTGSAASPVVNYIQNEPFCRELSAGQGIAAGVTASRAHVKNLLISDIVSE